MVHITFSLKVIAGYFQCSYIGLKFVGLCVCVYACMFRAHFLCAHPHVFACKWKSSPFTFKYLFSHWNLWLAGQASELRRPPPPRFWYYKCAPASLDFVLNVGGYFAWLHVFAPVCRGQKMFVGVPVSDGSWAWILYKSRKYSQVPQLHSWIHAWHGVFRWCCNVCGNSHDLPTELGGSHML